MDVLGGPAAYGSAAVQQDLHQTDHAGVVDFDAAEPSCADDDEQGRRLQQEETRRER